MLMKWVCLEMLTGQIANIQGGDMQRWKEKIVRVLVCANMTGSQKLPLLVISKFARPRCFKNVHILPVQYDSKVWMVSYLFSSWLLKLDRQFQHKHRKVAIVIDNCPAHATKHYIKTPTVKPGYNTKFEGALQEVPSNQNDYSC